MDFQTTLADPNINIQTSKGMPKNGKTLNKGSQRKISIVFKAIR
jgi:hypothetical protein